ncbi:MAG: hypothetical protein E7129_04230 [Rikenellaceae bacterium]|nr:hypothetical protein [Rikenellaceae bacterium]
MKRFLLILSALCIATFAFAQTSREEIDTHPHLAISTHSTYAGSYYFEPIAEAPKGYEPFYISHYGRHGSRYEANGRYSAELVEAFDFAEKNGLLTAKGKEVKAVVNNIHAVQDGHFGELTLVGAEQHKAIARRMYSRFKPVFKRGSIINSRSSTYTRCILSMAAFNESLKECKPLIETHLFASESDQKMIRPLGPLANEYNHNARRELVHDWNAILDSWVAKQDLSHATNSLFTNVEPICAHIGKSKIEFISSIYKRLAFMQNLGWHDRSLIDTIFTPAERHAMYKYENYRLFCIYGGTSLKDSNRYFATMDLLVDDIIKYADLAIEGKNNASADLRFGHDFYLLGLLATTNFNEIRMDCDYSDVDKLAEIWRSHQFITMASNMQFVFYHSKKSPGILVRILHNENDMTLPIESATAPFYKWEDVKKYLNNRIASFRK